MNLPPTVVIVVAWNLMCYKASGVTKSQSINKNSDYNHLNIINHWSISDLNIQLEPKGSYDVSIINSRVQKWACMNCYPEKIPCCQILYKYFKDSDLKTVCAAPQTRLTAYQILVQSNENSGRSYLETLHQRAETPLYIFCTSLHSVHKTKQCLKQPK